MTQTSVSASQQQHIPAMPLLRRQLVADAMGGCSVTQDSYFEMKLLTPADSMMLVLQRCTIAKGEDTSTQLHVLLRAVGVRSRLQTQQQCRNI